LESLVDQNRLLHLYTKQVNSPYPIAPGERNKDFLSDRVKDPFGFELLARHLNVTFSKHRDHPEIARAARAVRLDLAGGVLAIVIGFLIIAAIVFI
jgi:hypothetical protein